MFLIKVSVCIRLRHLISVLETGNLVVGWKVGLSQDLAATSNSKNAFLSFLLFAKPVWVIGAHAPPLPSRFEEIVII